MGNYFFGVFGVSKYLVFAFLELQPFLVYTFFYNDKQVSPVSVSHLPILSQFAFVPTL